MERLVKQRIPLTRSAHLFNPSTDPFVASIGQIESNYDETVDSFDTMNLKSELLRGTQNHSPSYDYGISVANLAQVSMPMVLSVLLLSSNVRSCLSSRVSCKQN